MTENRYLHYLANLYCSGTISIYLLSISSIVISKRQFLLSHCQSTVLLMVLTVGSFLLGDTRMKFKNVHVIFEYKSRYWPIEGPFVSHPLLGKTSYSVALDIMPLDSLHRFILIISLSLQNHYYRFTSIFQKITKQVVPTLKERKCLKNFNNVSNYKTEGSE